jgi:hypothetical protein
MALDLNIGYLKYDAAHHPPIYSMSRREHESLFAAVAGLPEPCPALERLSDYFSDASIPVAEVSALESALDAVGERAQSPDVRKAVEGLRLVCLYAGNHEMDIFAFSH